MSASTAAPPVAAAPCSRLLIDVGYGLVLIVRDMGYGEVAASLLGKSEQRPSLGYAVGPVNRAYVEGDGEDGNAVLWIDRAAFDVPIESVAELRAFLDAARAAGGA